MIYPHNFEQKTGFDKVRLLIAEKCLSPLGKERVAEMAFSANYQIITQLLEQTDEFLHILHGEDEFPANYFFDVRYSLKRIRPEGTWLDEKELFDKEYLLQLLSSSYMYLQYKALASGGVVNNLNSELVQSTTALIPSKDEQVKIGKYFAKLDNLITLHQCEQFLYKEN